MIARYWLPLVCLVFLGAQLGCGRVTTTQRLAGEWVGRPETAAERTARQSPQALLTPEEEQARRAQRGEPTDSAEEPAPQSDLEAYQFEIRLELGVDGTARMSQGGGAPLDGVWRVLSSEAGEIALQVTALRPTTGSEHPEREQRRFLAELIEEDRAMVLHEEGADPQFGVLRFERVGE
ncbi:hypothetical protein Pla175_04470 [Pirellulimonas nuda]|uniref:Uncharacterized protein n=1 Tax=Pirellulimonas nuda TaxID=2528009 RepID=A0A518D6I2_9BACT|nr:hypothetical protein [Pirellulimonas nuda]QDU87092.1 hypothetical protein Pla175_04470 [Pirellulimonas nuda]